MARSTRAIAVLIVVGGGCTSLAGLDKDFVLEDIPIQGTGSGGAVPDECPIGDDGCPCKPDQTCATDLTCTNGTCSDSDVCGCTDGYATMNDTCVWQGGPKDPSFEQSDAWQTFGGAEIIPSEPGNLAAGAVVFQEDALCRAGVRQSFVMPRYECAEQFILTSYVSTTCSGASFFCKIAKPTISARVNGGWKIKDLEEFFHSESWEPFSVCLGERAYGGSLDLSFFVEQSSCKLGLTLRLDDITITPDTTGQCPPIGQLLNGDFESGSASWTIYYNSNDGSIAEIGPGPGKDSSYGAHLAATGPCQHPSISNQISLPSARTLPNPALRVWNQGSQESILSVKFENQAIGYVVGTGAAKVTDFCLPRSAQGLVRLMTFNVNKPFSSSSATTCSDKLSLEFRFDDLQLVSNPDCPEDAYLFDPGFENISMNTSLGSTWELSSAPPSTSAQLIVNAGEAHDGNVSMKLTTSNGCQYAEGRSYITVPEPQDDEGPAIKFWYRANNFSNSSANFYPGGPLSQSTGWTQRTLCLDPQWAGRSELITFRIKGSSGDCQVSFPAESMYVDDVEVTTDPGCPAL